MSVNRGALSATPLILRATPKSFRPLPSPLYRRQPPIALLLPYRRRYATESSTSHGGSGSSFPPPGFNSEQAKRPLRQDQDAADSKAPAEDKKPSDAPSSASTSGSNAPSEHKSKAVSSAEEDDKTLDRLAAEKAASGKQLEQKKGESKKLTMWQKVKKEAAHYWDGTKLLAAETRISFKLALKMAAGYELSRREHRQFQRTVQDLGRLIPFSVFVLVPFAELLLPVALRLFPNLLPSTYESQKTKDAKATSLRNSRKEVSSFIRQTLRETGLPVSAATAQREEFIDFFRKIRSTGEQPTAPDVIKVCKIFKDDLTLDNLSRPQLVGLTRYMNLNTIGTDAILRYQIRHRMRQIKRDDRAISYEGVDSLSTIELQNACASRGIRTYGVSPARLRDDLQMWLDCRLRYGVPSILLVLSNAFVYAQGKDTELASQIDALQAVLASVPEELFHEIELEVHTAEGAATNKQRLEVLKEQQELIEEETKQNQEEEKTGRSAPSDRDNIDETDESREGEVERMEAEAHAASGKQQQQQQQHGAQDDKKA